MYIHTPWKIYSWNMIKALLMGTDKLSPCVPDKTGSLCTFRSNSPVPWGPEYFAFLEKPVSPLPVILLIMIRMIQ